MKECRILVVDDEHDFLETLVQRMKMRKMTVEGVEGGAEALAFLDREPADVVLLDVKMPGMDGIEVLGEIKKRHPRVEVIMLTGHADVDVAVEGIALGAFDYLMKPADLEDLLFKVKKAYEKKVLEEGD